MCRQLPEVGYVIGFVPFSFHESAPENEKHDRLSGLLRLCSLRAVDVHPQVAGVAVCEQDGLFGQDCRTVQRVRPRATGSCSTGVKLPGAGGNGLEMVSWNRMSCIRSERKLQLPVEWEGCYSWKKDSPLHKNLRSGCGNFSAAEHIRTKTCTE